MSTYLIAVVIIGLIVVTCVLVVNKINQPSLGKNFVLTRHSVTVTSDVRSEQYCFATNVSPQDFVKSFRDLSLVNIQVYSKDTFGTVVNFSKPTRGNGYVTYETKQQLKQFSYKPDDFVCDDFHGMKYTIHLWDNDMWVINPNNVNPTIREGISDGKFHQ